MSEPITLSQALEAVRLESAQINALAGQPGEWRPDDEDAEFLVSTHLATGSRSAV